MDMEQDVLDEMERKLCFIADIVEDDEVECEVYTADAGFELPTLVIHLPDDLHDLPRILLMTFVPIPEVGEFTDYIQFYLEFPYDLSDYEEIDLLRAIDGLNRQLPLGHASTLVPRKDQLYEKMASLRYMYAISNEQEIDEGNLLETLMLFLISCDAVEERFMG